MHNVDKGWNIIYAGLVKINIIGRQVDNNKLKPSNSSIIWNTPLTVKVIESILNHILSPTLFTNVPLCF